MKKVQPSGDHIKDLTSVKRFLIRSGRKLPNPIKAKIRRLVRKQPPPKPAKPPKPPKLSIVVPVYNVESYVQETLDSLVSQTLTDWEAIVVNDGSTDASGIMVDKYAKLDSRIRIIHQNNAGLGAARNVGIAAARGKYLTFLDSDDIIPPKAYELAVATLHATKSDFAIGGVDRLNSGKRYTPPFTNLVHARERLKTNATEFPDIIMDVIACNRIFNTQFWLTNIGAFPQDVAYEDHRVMVAALARAKSIDILPQKTYVWRIRENNSSISQQKADTQNLIDCINAKDETYQILTTESTTNFLNAWLTRLLDGGVPIFAPFALSADDEYRILLSRHAAKFVNLAPESAWDDVRWDNRVKTLLIAQSKWEELGKFLLDLKISGGVPHTIPHSDTVHLEMSDWPAEIGNALAGHTILGRRQTQLIARLTSARWTKSGLSVNGFCYISHLHQDFNSIVEISLMNERTGNTVTVGTAQLKHDEYASRYANHRNFDYAFTGVSFTVDWQTIAKQTQNESFSIKDRLRLLARKRVGNVCRESIFDTAHRTGSGSAFNHSKLSVGDTDLSVIPHRDASSFSLQFKPIHAELVDLDVVDDHVQGKIQLPERQSKQPEKIFFADNGADIENNLQPDTTNNRQYMFANLKLPQGSTSRLKVRFTDGSSRALTYSLDSQDTLLYESISAQKSSFGYIDLISNSHGAVVSDIQRDGSILSLTGSYFGPDISILSELQLSQETGDICFTPSTLKLSDSIFKASFDLNFISRQTSLLRGVFHFTFGDCQLTLQPSLVESMPAVFLTSEYRVEFIRGAQAKGRPLLVKFDAPLNEAEIGTWNQLQLRRWYRETEFQPEDAALFQCYRGESASDNQMPIFNELASRNTGLKVYWGVADGGVDVPEGAIPVVIGSKEWYRVLGSSRYLCNNIDFDSFFVRRHYQKLLSTFHGHPFKSMGRTFWESKNYNPFQIDYEIQRRKSAWSSALMPNVESVKYYEDEYDYDGEFLVAGYPRNDSLSNGSSETARQRISLAYGLGYDSSKWVLYAPTWREASATGAWSAKMFEDLDLEVLSRSLGPEWSILVRGHGYNSRESARVRRSASIVDVTDYHEINDLILAADVAVLDYSSLRFDWAITEKPMVFFVPDKDEYFSLRPCLFDYDESAPGVQTSTTEDTADEILRHHEYLHRFGQNLQRFNRRFNDLSDGKSASRVVDHFFSEDLR